MRQNLSASLMDRATLLGIMGSFPSGVVVVTAIEDDGTPRGLTAIAFCSVSLEPPLCLVCVGAESRTLPIITNVGQFAVNLLRFDQQPIAERFASKVTDKFNGIGWQRGSVCEQPVICGTIGHIECSLWQSIPAGDHVVLLGRVEAGSVDASSSPLIYFRRDYHSFGWANRLTSSDSFEHTASPSLGDGSSRGEIGTQVTHGIE